MSSKSLRGRSKHPSRHRKGKVRHGSPAIATRQQAVAQTYKPVSEPKISAPQPSVPTPTAEPAVFRYPHIITELRRIGILAGIMLAILTTLALTLS